MVHSHLWHMLCTSAVALIQHACRSVPAILAAADAAMHGYLGTDTLNDGQLTAHKPATADRVTVWHLGEGPLCASSVAECSFCP